jgi:5'-3' exonuclease
VTDGFRPAASPDVLILDGMNLAFKCLFAGTSGLSSGDEQTGVVFGALRQVNSLLNKFWPKAIIICWEGRHGKQRRLDIFQEYKAKRKGKLSEEQLDSLFSQVAVFKELMGFFGVAQLTIDNCEGDDILFAVATGLAARGVSTVIVSGDQDLLQALSPLTSWYDTTRDNLVTPQDFRRMVDIPQERFVDWLCIVGDTSDDIPGIRGVGPDTITPILQEMSLEDFWSAREPKGKKLQAVWGAEGRATIALFRKIINLQTFQTPELFAAIQQEVNIPPADFDEAREIIVELNFASLTGPETWAPLCHNFAALDMEWFSDVMDTLACPERTTNA